MDQHSISPHAHGGLAPAPWDRRCLTDRRRTPTRLWTTLRLPGRRALARREGEAYDGYIDCLSRSTVALALAVFFASLLDAVFTLIHLEHGRLEVNPLMRLALAAGDDVFLAVKTWGIGLSVAFLAAHQNFRLGILALRAAALIYGTLVLYHLFLFWL